MSDDVIDVIRSIEWKLLNIFPLNSSKKFARTCIFAFYSISITIVVLWIEVSGIRTKKIKSLKFILS